MATTEYVPAVRTLYVTDGSAQADAHVEALSAYAPVQVTRARRSEATSVAAASPDLALVAVDGGGDESAGAALVSEFQRLDPALPLIWLGPTISLSKFGASPPDRLLSDPSPQDCENAVRDLLRFDVYCPPVVRAVVDSALGTLGHAFHSPVEDYDVFFKANQLVFAPTSALLPFSGAKLSGWCLVSGDEQALTAIRASILPNAGAPSQADLEDVTGEMANHIVAHVKRWLARQKLKVSNGTPILLHGTEYRLREKGGWPGVTVRPKIDGRLTVQLTLDVGCGLDLVDPEARVEIESSAFEMLT